MILLLYQLSYTATRGDQDAGRRGRPGAFPED